MHEEFDYKEDIRQLHHVIYTGYNLAEDHIHLYGSSRCM